MAEGETRGATRRREKRRRPDGAAGTSLDALAAKLACSKLGYFEDPFLQEFGVKYSRKSPIIHRGKLRSAAASVTVDINHFAHSGYFARYKLFRETLRNFNALHNGVCQVIALGGGLDTTYFDMAVCAASSLVHLPTLCITATGT